MALASSEVLQVGICGDEVISAEHITSTLRLPDHFKGHEFSRSRGTENAQGLAQIFAGVGPTELGRCR